MKTVLIGAMLVAALGGTAGAYYRPQLDRDVPGPTLVVTKTPERAADRYWSDYGVRPELPYGG